MSPSLKPGVANTADIPETRISSLLQYSPEERHRVRVRGTLTLVDPNGAAFLEDSTAGLRVQATLPGDLHPGDEVEAVGRPVPGPFSVILKNVEVRKLGRAAPLSPPDASAEDALTGGLLAPATLGYAASKWGVGVVMGLPLAGTFMVMALLLLIWLEAKVTGR